MSGFRQRRILRSGIPALGGGASEIFLIRRQEIRTEAAGQGTQECGYVMNAWNLNAFPDQGSLHIFLHALLGMETDGICRTEAAQGQRVRGIAEVVFRLGNPIP